MTNSKIEWTDKTHNFLRGCTRVSEGCRFCYAERLAARFGKAEGNPYQGYSEFKHGQPHWTGKVEVIENKLDQPLRWRKPSLIFVNSMSDTFHESVSDVAISQAFEVMDKAYWHQYQILTKRPERMLEMWESNLLPRGDNFWYGVSIENVEAAKRCKYLVQMDARVRWVSAEPLLEDITDAIAKYLPDLDWVVCGGESGPLARPMEPEWAYHLYVVCTQSATRYFFKQMGGRRNKGVKELIPPLPGHSKKPIINQYPIDVEYWQASMDALMRKTNER